MDPIIDSVAKDVGANIDSLKKAYTFSKERISSLRNAISNNISGSKPENFYNIACLGSIARKEATTGSDIDYLVIAHRLPNDMNEIKFRSKLIEAVN